MQVVLVMWLLLAGMKAVLWEGTLERDGAPAGLTEVTAADGPTNPPPKP